MNFKNKKDYSEQRATLMNTIQSMMDTASTEELQAKISEKAQEYVKFIEELAGVPVSMIAVGPDREQTIMRNW